MKDKDTVQRRWRGSSSDAPQSSGKCRKWRQEPSKPFSCRSSSSRSVPIILPPTFSPFSNESIEIKKNALADAFKILPCTQAEWNEKSTFVQAEKERLLEDVSKLTREKGLVELRLRSYETENTQLAPTLEETQWEVSRESFMWDISKVGDLVTHSTNWYNLDYCCWSVGTSSYSIPTGKICHFAPYLRNRGQSKESGIQTPFIFFSITDSVAFETSGTLRTISLIKRLLWFIMTSWTCAGVVSLVAHLISKELWDELIAFFFFFWVKWFCLMRKVWLSVMNPQRNISSYVVLFKRASAN